MNRRRLSGRLPDVLKVISSLTKLITQNLNTKALRFKTCLPEE